MLQFAALALSFIELRAHGGQIFCQACVEQLLAQVGKICVHVNRPQVLGQRQGRPEVGRMHDFQVLLVLRGRTTGHLIDPLANMPGILHRLKMIEGGEKVIVPRLPGDGDEGSHGKRIDQLVIKFLVGKRVGGGHSFFAANRLWRQAARHGRGFVKHQGFGVDAEIVLRGVADEAFRVHGADQVHVQIGAFRHVVKKSIKSERPLLAGLLQGSSGADFAILRGGLRLREGGRGQGKQQRGRGQAE